MSRDKSLSSLKCLSCSPPQLKAFVGRFRNNCFSAMVCRGVVTSKVLLETNETRSWAVEHQSTLNSVSRKRDPIPKNFLTKKSTESCENSISRISPLFQRSRDAPGPYRTSSSDP